MSGQTPSLTDALAGLLTRPVRPGDRTIARRHLLDWLACIAGARPSAMAAVAARAEPDVLTRAALLGNVIEMDDVDRLGRLHPGPVVWPAALSAAREVGGTLGALLDGAVRGYEAMIRTGRALDDHHYAHWHPTSTAGGIGAAAAAAAVFGLSRDETVWAIGHAGSLAGGLWQVRHEPGAMTKSLHVAQAALSGLWHARLARAGAAGPRHILDGPQGLLAATTRAPHVHAITGGADDPWRIADVSLKPWAACRHAHPAIDAALALWADAAPGDALLSGPITVATYVDALRFCDREQPSTPDEARFSIQHAVAVVALRGRPGPADFDADACRDPALAAVRARIGLRADAALSAAYPARYGARVSAGGRSAMVADAWGDAQNPLDEPALRTKLEQLVMAGGLGAADAAAAWGAAMAAGDDSPAAAIIRLLDGWLPREMDPA